MGKRELIQTFFIIFSFLLYLIGKNNLELLTLSLLVPLSSIGFFLVAFTITTNLTRSEMNVVDKIISIAIFILLLLFGLAIYIEFFLIDVFRHPLFLPALSMLGINAFLVLVKNELAATQNKKQLEHTEN